MMNWTTKSPTEPGWYWYRHAPSSQPEIFQARNTKDGISIYLDEWRKPSWFDGEWLPNKIPEPITSNPDKE